MMSLNVVPEQLVDELVIKSKYIITQKRAVPHDEVFPYSAVEPFNVRIHLGTT